MILLTTLLISLTSFSTWGAEPPKAQPGTPAAAAAPGTAKPGAPAPTPSATAISGSAALAQQLQNALLESEPSLGTLEPWQKKIFVEEAAPQYQRFIRDYRRSTTGVQVDVDFDSLRNYLRFYGPKTLKREKPQVLVLLKPEAECESCVAATAGIKALVKDRLERRGLIPIWGELPAGENLEERLDMLAAEKKAVGALLVNWETASEDEDNGAHAGEERYVIRDVLAFRDLARIEGEMEILIGNAFEKTAARLLTDAFTQLGAKSERLEARQSELKRSETLLALSGFKSFAQYAAAKAKIEEKLANLATVEERKISRGRAVLAIFSEKNPEQIRVAIGKSDDPTIQMEILP